MKKRIGITQRCDKVDARDEWRDSLDIRWCNLLWKIGYIPIPISNSISENSHTQYLNALSIHGIVLSGGNDLNQYPPRDLLEENLLYFAAKHSLEVLGVCRGMQVMNKFQGGHLVEITGHVSTKHNLIGNWASEHCEREVNSFHKYAITKDTLGKNLEILAWTDDGSIEAFRHKSNKWLGLMWHPERGELSTMNSKIIKNHLG